MLQNFYFTKDARNSNAHYWVIPRSIVEELSQSPQVVIEVMRGRTVGEITHTLHKRLIKHKQVKSLGQYVNNSNAGLLFYCMNETTSLEHIQQHLELLDSYGITDNDMNNWINTNYNTYERREYKQHTTDLDLAQEQAYDLEESFKIKLMRDLLTKANQLNLLDQDTTSGLFKILAGVDYDYELSYYDDLGARLDNRLDYWGSTKTAIRDYRNTMEYRIELYYRMPIFLTTSSDRQAIFIDLFKSIVDERCYLRVDELIKQLHSCYSGDYWSEFRQLIAYWSSQWTNLKQQQLALDQASRLTREIGHLLLVARHQMEHMISTQASVGELNITN